MRRVVVIAVGEVEDDEDIEQLQTRIKDVLGVDAVALLPGDAPRVDLSEGHAN